MRYYASSGPPIRSASARTTLSNAFAEYHFSREEYDLAAERYQLIVAQYGGSEWTDLSGYRIGLCYFLSSRGAGYDRTPLQQAAAAFRAYLAKQGTQNFRTEAEDHLVRTEELLAEGELKVAELYLIRGQDRGARIHLANCALAYPSTAAATKARDKLEERGWDLSINSLDTIIPSGQAGGDGSRP